MKKILSMCIVAVLLISGFGVVAFPDEIYQEKMTLHFSQLTINENDDRVTLELEGTNSVLMKYNHYVVPTRIETFTFPLGTEIKKINCIPRNIHRETITKELIVAPEPIPLGYTHMYENTPADANPISINNWYDYDIGTGINGHRREIFVKVQVFPGT